nr:hypothetical protein [Tanacetum cinerariifolium]
MDKETVILMGARASRVENHNENDAFCSVSQQNLQDQMDSLLKTLKFNVYAHRSLVPCLRLVIRFLLLSLGVTSRFELSHSSFANPIATNVSGNNMSGTVVGDRGVAVQCISSTRQCTHSSGFDSSHRTARQSSFVNSDSHAAAHMLGLCQTSGSGSRGLDQRWKTFC